MGFKDFHSLDIRLAQSKHILKKYPDRIPCLIEKNPNSQIALADKIKFLVPEDLKIGQLVHVIRKRLNLSAEKGIFLLINNIIPPSSSMIYQLYEEYKDEDNFLYIIYSGENTFGTIVES
jgi:GABA(A) receptor-associated protein